jgi:hypothetical protein
MGKHTEEFGLHGTLNGTEAELSKYEEVLVKEGYRVEYFKHRGVKTLHYQKEGMYDAIVGRTNVLQPGGSQAPAEGVSSFVSS